MLRPIIIFGLYLPCLVAQYHQATHSGAGDDSCNLAHNNECDEGAGCTDSFDDDTMKPWGDFKNCAEEHRQGACNDNGQVSCRASSWRLRTVLAPSSELDD